MGVLKDFQCNKCGYWIHFAGELSIGMIAVTKPYYCTKCKELNDITVGFRGKVYTYCDIDKKKYSDWELDIIKDLYKCPECDKSEYLVEWDTEKRPCPECDGKLEIDPEGSETFWD